MKKIVIGIAVILGVGTMFYLLFNQDKTLEEFSIIENVDYPNIKNIDMGDLYPATFEELNNFDNNESLVYLMLNESLEDGYSVENPESSSEMFTIVDASVIKLIDGVIVPDQIKLYVPIYIDDKTLDVTTNNLNLLFEDHEYLAYIEFLDGVTMEYIKSIGVEDTELTNLYKLTNADYSIVDVNESASTLSDKYILSEYSGEVESIKQEFEANIDNNIAN